MRTIFLACSLRDTGQRSLEDRRSRDEPIFRRAIGREASVELALSRTSRSRIRSPVANTRAAPSVHQRRLWQGQEPSCLRGARDAASGRVGDVAGDLDEFRIAGC